MIANAKLFKQRNGMEANREYSQRLQDTVDEIMANNQDIECEYLQHKENPHTFTIVYCSDLGLCGGYNANIMRMVKENLNSEDPTILIGTKLYRQFKEANFNLLQNEPIESNGLQPSQLKKYVDQGINLFRENKVGKVQIIYTKFVNTMTFKPEIDILLPFSKSETSTTKTSYVETLFEPNPQVILNQLIPMMIHDVAYSDLMEASTSEQGSRRVAMKTASDNADDLSQTLQLEFNKARQAAITQEITEIVGGSSAV